QGASAAAVAGQSGATLTLAELALLQQATLAVAIPDSVRAAYWQIEDALENAGLPTTSTRRLGWIWDVVAASALLHGRTTANEDDLLPLRHALWQEKQHITAVRAVVFQAASPIIAKATELYDMTLAEVNDALALLAQPTDATTREEAVKRNARAQEAAHKLGTAKNEMLALFQQARGAGRDTTDIARMGKDLEAKRLQLARAVLGDDLTPTTTW
ncbi:MAG: hypothetical protein KGK07_17000, partial [Chloroflexota bacterium]|nr:hypothetical protein [Chloroflexota bacterium]